MLTKIKRKEDLATFKGSPEKKSKPQDSFKNKKEVLQETISHMKLVVEQDMQNPGGYVGKMYYFDEFNNVARLLIDDIGLYSVQA